MNTYIQNSLPELKQLIRDLCAIPAPSHHEEKRAEFIQKWMISNGFPHVFVDEAHNVLSEVGEGDVTVFLAHTDTVFPDLTPMAVREENGRYYCPGVTDDTAQLAVLLICARYFLQRSPKHGIVIAANSCEEGLGNLKGSRAIVARYGSRMKELVAIDHHNLHEVVGKAVGSRRYRVTVRTEGGHSFTKFGNPNAIHKLAQIIDRLYQVEVPVIGDSKTTYNVGLISGGTSVNTIAQEAQMLYEYRSDSHACMAEMERQFRAIVEDAEVELIGERPCAAEVDTERQTELLERTKAVFRTALHIEPEVRAGSTDCNAALGAGIPAICFGGCIGGGTHTREEYLELDSLERGCRLLMTFMDHYFA